MSGFYVNNPDLFFDDLAVVGEVGFVHVNGVEHVASSPGIIPVDNGDKLFYDRNSYGGNLLIIPTAHNILPAWDLSMPVTFAYLEEIGRASCRERVCQYVLNQVVAVSLKKKKKQNHY